MASSMPMIRLESLSMRRANDKRMRSSSYSVSSSSTSTKSIPIHLNQDDIQEEWEIREQEWIAEERDSVIFHRIVSGMIARQSSSNASNSSYQSETDKSIANIMRTRYNNKSMGTKFKKAFKLDDDDDEETEYAWNGSNPNRSDTTANAAATDDRPPDTIFVMDM